MSVLKSYIIGKKVSIFFSLDCDQAKRQLSNGQIVSSLATDYSDCLTLTSIKSEDGFLSLINSLEFLIRIQGQDITMVPVSTV